MQDQRTGRTVYIVSSGEYSDYDVDCVFDRQEDAERYVELGLASRVEERTLYSEMPPVFTVYRAEMAKPYRGGLYPVGLLRETDLRSLEEPKHAAVEYEWAFVASGPDQERVRKSVTDRYAAWKAQQVLP